jgi:UDP-glucose 4-epimerase
MSAISPRRTCAIDYLADGNSSTSINLGTGVGTSVMEIIKAVERECGSPVAYSVGPRRAGDAPILVANPAKARTAPKRAAGE